MIKERLEFLQEKANEAKIHVATFIALLDLVRNGVADPVKPTEIERSQFREAAKSLQQVMTELTEPEVTTLMTVLMQAAAQAPVTRIDVPGVYCIENGRQNPIEVWAEVDGKKLTFHCRHWPISHTTQFP